MHLTKEEVYSYSQLPYYFWQKLSVLEREQEPVLGNQPYTGSALYVPTKVKNVYFAIVRNVIVTNPI